MLVWIGLRMKVHLYNLFTANLSQHKVPENEGEEKANIENPEGAVQMEDLTRGNSTNPPVPTKDPDPHPPKKVRKEKAQLFEPIQLPLAARKFCFFP